MIKVNEHFYNIQGEGPNIGTPSYLIRFSGCNLHCNNCDSKYSWLNDGEDLKEVVKNLDIPKQCNNVVITGGEPSLHFGKEDFRLLLNRISGKSLEIETTALPIDISLLKTENIYETLMGFNGNIYRYKKDNHITQYRISPKLDLSIPAYQYYSIAKEDIFRYYNITKRPNDWSFIYKIIFNQKDENIIEEFIDNCVKNEYFRNNKLFMMPFTPVGLEQNTFEEVYNLSCMETIEFCKKHGLRYTPRVHIDVYGVERGV